MNRETTHRRAQITHDTIDTLDTPCLAQSLLLGAVAQPTVHTDFLGITPRD